MYVYPDDTVEIPSKNHNPQSIPDATAPPHVDDTFNRTFDGMGDTLSDGDPDYLTPAELPVAAKPSHADQPSRAPNGDVDNPASIYLHM